MITQPMPPDTQPLPVLLEPTPSELRRLLEVWPDAVLVNRTGPILFANQAMTRALGYTREELCSLTVWDLLLPEEHEPVRERSKMLKSGGPPAPLRVCRMRHKDGHIVLLESSGVVSEYDGIPAMIVVFRDVTERTERELLAQRQLRETEERWQFALEGSDQGVWDWNTQTNEVYFSPRWKSMLGFEPDELAHTLESWSGRVHPEDLPGVMAEVDRHFRGETPVYETEHRVLCKDGTYKWILDRGRVTSRTPDGKVLRMVGTHTDITARKEAENFVRRSLAEKEVMLREIHHRVKNNLQVISSLLSLQASGVEDPTLRAVLQESQGRVHSIALLHERLYEVADFAHIDLAEYVQSLVQDVRRGLAPPGIEVSVQAAHVRIGIDIAVPFALLLNELITNAFKHAFPKGAGHLEVTLREGPGHALLTVRDDGVGLPAGFATHPPKSLGMTLVHMLVKQLHGSIDITGDHGTSVSISFPSAPLTFEKRSARRE